MPVAREVSRKELRERLHENKGLEGLEVSRKELRVGLDYYKPGLLSEKYPGRN